MEAACKGGMKREYARRGQLRTNCGITLGAGCNFLLQTNTASLHASPTNDSSRRRPSSGGGYARTGFTRSSSITCQNSFLCLWFGVSMATKTKK